MPLNFIPFWIVNITPDSFSDGGVWENNPQQLSKILSQLPTNYYLDIGAESTAPGRVAVSVDDEISRLEVFFREHLFKLKRKLRLSFDTYKKDTILWCLKECSKLPQVEEVIWNDVSGIYQDEVIEILKSHPKLKYILCHNKVRNREEVLSHTKMAQDNTNQEFMHEIIDFFKNAEKFFTHQGAVDRVIFDPAFGFAKTREQNLYLFENTDKLLNEFLGMDFMLGISKKSFLREINKTIHDPGQNELAQVLEATYFNHINSTSKKIYVRTHSLPLLKMLVAD